MIEIDRMAIVLKPTEVMVDWISTVQQCSADELQALRTTSSIVLIPVCETEGELAEYFESHYTIWMEAELSQWISEETQWPEMSNFMDFQTFFNISCYSTIYDMVMEDYEEFEMVTLQ